MATSSLRFQIAIPVTLLYWSYQIFLLVALAGPWDFATVSLVIASIHFVGLFSAMLPGLCGKKWDIQYVEGLPPHKEDFWPYGTEHYWLNILIIAVDGLQFFFALIPSIVYVAQEKTMPIGWVVVVTGSLFIGIATCFVKFNQMAHERNMSSMGAEQILAMFMFNLSFILVITAIATTHKEKECSDQAHHRILGFLWGALVADVVSWIMAMLTFVWLSSSLLFVSKKNKRSWLAIIIRGAFVESGLLYLAFLSIAAALLQWGRECSVHDQARDPRAANCTWIAAILYIGGASLMHMMTSKQPVSSDITQKQQLSGEEYPILGSLPDELNDPEYE